MDCRKDISFNQGDAHERDGIAMSLLHRGRGVEHEYILNTDPPLRLDENVERRRLIARAIDGLGQAGVLFPNVSWSLKGEDGNPAYENSLSKLWPFETPPPVVGKNGMRIYDDALHLEISTPVYSSAEAAVAYAKVSEYIAFLGSQQAVSLPGLKAYCYTSNVSLLRVGSAGYEASACGTHGNITLSRQAFNLSKLKDARRALIPYLVTRIILTGSGGYVPYVIDERGRKITQLKDPSSTLVGKDILFVISPRSHFVNRIESLDTTIKRGLFNLRDEPHAYRDLYWRFHDINWEGIRSDLQIYMRDLLQGFVVAAFERGYLQDAPIMSDPLGQLIQISMDTSLDWRVSLSNCQVVDAIEGILIGYYLKKIEMMLDREKAPCEDWSAFKLLSEFLSVVSQRDLTRLVYCLDWVTKFFLIGACDSSKEGRTACNQFCLIDQSILKYLGEDVNEEGDSLFEPDESISAFVKWVPGVTPEGLKNAVKQALFNPPLNTRETKRIQLLAEKSDANLEASWEFVVDEDEAESWLSEPLQPHFTLQAK
jgi:hypothetical protein